jgi:hypothetical protein
MEKAEKEKMCLGEIYVDFSKYIYAELRVPCPKENLRTSFFKWGCLM